MKRGARAMLLPLVLWTILLVAVPIAYMIVLSFSSGDSYGVSYALTLNNYRKLLDADTLIVILKTLRTSFWVTALTLITGYPFAYFMAKANRKWRNVLLLLVIVPFWTSALMRMSGWRIFFQNNGIFNSVLLWLGVIREPVKWMYTYGLVLFGMAYTMLPFMILPIYTSIEKLDPSHADAARDLGANPVTAFFTVTLPLTYPGVISGAVLTFVPSAGLFFINQILGGGRTMLLGDQIDLYFKAGRNWGYGAALSILLLIMSLISMAIYRRVSDGSDMGVF